MTLLRIVPECTQTNNVLPSDMESIDALAKAVNEFTGGLVLVSHDMRLISQVAKEIWLCDHKTVTKYKGDIGNFKMDMRAQMGIEGEQKGQLRGDASVVKKKGDAKPKAAPKKPQPKIEAVSPTQIASSFETKSMEKSLPEPTPKAAPEPAPAPAAPAPAPAAAEGGAPAKKRYIPPHLRKKMQG